MGNFWSLVYFEFKKTLKKKQFGYIVIICIILMALVVISSISGESFYHSEGRKISRYTAMKMDKEVILSNQGEITTKLVKEAMSSNKEMIKNDENYLINKYGRHLKSDAYIKYTLPYGAIANLVDVVYEKDKNWLSKDALLLTNVKPENAIDTLELDKIDNFDNDLKEFAKSMVINNEGLTSKEIQKNMEMIDQIKLPLYNDYYGGYIAYINNAKGLALVCFLSILIMLAPIFSREYEEKTAPIILATKNGKNSLCSAKIFVALSISFVSSILIMGSSWLIFLMVFGFEGANVNIQLLDPSCTYDLTLQEACMINFVSVVLAETLFGAFIAFLSGRAENKTSSVIIKGVIVTLVPMFVWVPLKDSRLLYNVLKFFPVNMATFKFDMSFFEIFGHLVAPYKVIWAASIVFIIILGKMAVKSFRKHQVN